MILSLEKKRDLTRFFIIKPRHPGRPRKADLGGKKNSVGAWVTCEKTPMDVT